MATDPIELELDGQPTAPTTDEHHVPREYIDYVEPSAEWTQMRDAIAMNMWNSR